MVNVRKEGKIGRLDFAGRSFVKIPPHDLPDASLKFCVMVPWIIFQCGFAIIPATCTFYIVCIDLHL